MAREFASPVRFAQVATLPPAASNPGVVLEQGARLWFSNGAAWIDLGATGGGGGSTDWTVVTAGQTLADDVPLLAVITTAATFPIPASVTVGHAYIIRNASTSAALVSVDPGAGRQIQGCPVAGILTIAPGEVAHLVARTTAFFEILTPGAVGPAGPAGAGAAVTSTVTPLALAATAAIGTSTEAARADHVHIRPTLGELGAAAATHTHTAAQISDSTAAGRSMLTAADAAAQRTLLNVANGATANATDAALRDRATHTGTQAASTISDFAASARTQVEGTILAGTNITITPAGSGATRTLTIAAAGGGGGGTPGGTSGQVQFNNAGAFGGASHAAIEAGRIVHNDYAEHGILTAPPATPGAGRLRVYARSRAGRAFLEWVGPSGLDISAQPALFNNRVMVIAPGSGTGVTATGITTTNAATLSHPGLSGASIAQATYRTRCQTSATAGNAAGIRHAAATMARGNAGFPGGFYFHARVCSGALVLAGGEAFVGLSSSTAALAGAPSALADAIGIVKDVADTAWHFTRRTGTGTIVRIPLTTALNYTANVMFDLVMFCVPGGSAINVLVRRFDNAGVAHTHLDASYTTDIPAAGTFLAGRFDIRNGATAAAADFELARMYAESDF